MYSTCANMSLHESLFVMIQYPLFRHTDDTCSGDTSTPWQGFAGIRKGKKKKKKKTVSGKDISAQTTIIVSLNTIQCSLPCVYNNAQ